MKFIMTESLGFGLSTLGYRGMIGLLFKNTFTGLLCYLLFFGLCIFAIIGICTTIKWFKGKKKKW